MATGKAIPPRQWDAEALRVSVFSHPDSPIPQKDWWKEVVGTTPDSQASQPKDGISQQSGEVDGKTLVITSRTDRLDLQLDNVPMPGEDKKPSLGLIEALEWFAVLAKKLLRITPPSSRIAFGGILRSPVKDRIQGYKELQPYLADSVALDPDGSSDLYYQINRPRKTAAINSMVNRLMKWSVSMRQLTVLRMASGQAIGSAPRYLMSLEFDINTVPEYLGPIDNDQQIKLFDEFMVLAREISEKGDVK